LIRVNPRNHNGKYHSLSGKYFPMHPEKFAGNYTPIYKSGLEQRMMMYLDRNPMILSWSYEPMPIKYFDRSTNKVRRYYIDFVALARTNTGTKKIWIEVKDRREAEKPKNPNNIKENLTWLKNQSKWDAARRLAKSKGYEFVVITNDQLD